MMTYSGRSLLGELLALLELLEQFALLRVLQNEVDLLVVVEVVVHSQDVRVPEWGNLYLNFYSGLLTSGGPGSRSRESAGARRCP